MERNITVSDDAYKELLKNEEQQEFFRDTG